MKNGLIVVPACNEGRSLADFLPKLQMVCRGLPWQTEIVVVDDGSSDDTAQVAQRGGATLLQNGKNLGLGFSLRRGYERAVANNCDFLVSMDSDGQHDPGLLAQVIAPLFEEVDLVTASRYHPDSQRVSPPVDRDLLNVAVTSMIHSVTGWKHLTDALTGFWAMNQRIARFLAENLKLERYGTCLEAYIKMWHLLEPKPALIEVSHPAIYANHNSGVLNREYSHDNQETRVERFGTHALHIVMALEDIQTQGVSASLIEEMIRSWRVDQWNHQNGPLGD